MTISLTDVEQFQLSNGLTIIAREDHTVPIVTSMLWYRVGSRDEGAGLSGISHFLEHMMFKGTRRLSKGEIDDITTRNGGHNNAFTAHDYTSYYFSFASDRWLDALRIEADRMIHTVFDADEVETERQVILEELAMGLDDPWEAMRLEVDLHAFPNHPYRYPIIGLEEDLRRISREDLLAHYRRYYIPGNATLAIVGDFATDSTLEKIEALFSPLAPGTATEPVRLPGANRNAGHELVVARPSLLPRLVIALPAPSACTDELPLLHVTDRLLSEGKLSILYQRLVEQEQLVSMVTTEVEETLDPYHLFIRLDLQDPDRFGRVEEIIFEELSRLAEFPVDPGALERAKNQCKSQFLSEFETTFDQAFQLGLWQILADWRLLQQYMIKIDAVTSDAVNAFAARYFGRAESVLCRMFPSE